VLDISHEPHYHILTYCTLLAHTAGSSIKKCTTTSDHSTAQHIASRTAPALTHDFQDILSAEFGNPFSVWYGKEFTPQTFLIQPLMTYPGGADIFDSSENGTDGGAEWNEDWRICRPAFSVGSLFREPLG